MPTRFDNQPGGTLEYSSNNSGGRWWLMDHDWVALEAAGWKVEWYKDIEDAIKDKDGERFLGALAHDASKEFAYPEQGVDEFQRITGQDASDEGCNCCGPPHNFTWRDPDGTTKYMNIYRGAATYGFS